MELQAADHCKKPWLPSTCPAGPLLRATLLQLDDADHVLLLTMHHIVSDGWSMGVFVQELTILYDALLYRAAVAAAGTTLYSMWILHSGSVNGCKVKCWRPTYLIGSNNLTAHPLSFIATDRPRPAVQSFRGAVQSFMVPAPVSEALKALGGRKGGRCLCLLLAAFQDVSSPLYSSRRSELWVRLSPAAIGRRAKS